MENTDTITWQIFKNALMAKPGLDLQFQYADNKWVDASYHITEVKQAPITSVDCGGVMNSWTEVIVQLWEPNNKEQLRAMKVSKALSIFDLVEKNMPINPDAMVKIEFGNDKFDTRQMYPGQFIDSQENLVVDLRADSVQCKAIARGGSCGIEEKPKTEIKNLTTSAACCTPGGSCC